jgi:hypothetical protein
MCASATYGISGSDTLATVLNRINASNAGVRATYNAVSDISERVGRHLAVMHDSWGALPLE